MKATVGFFMLVCMLTYAAACGATRSSGEARTADEMIGLWEVKAIHNSNE